MSASPQELVHFQQAVNGETIREQQKHIAELETVLRAIVHEYDQTYDADCEPGGHWQGAASISLDVMNHAKRLIA